MTIRLAWFILGLRKPSHLIRGGNNLESKKWAEEFREALSTVTIEDEAAEMVSQDPDISFGEAMNYLREMKEQDEEFAQYEAARLVIAQEWAQESKQPLAKIQGVIRKFDSGWDMVDRKNFSTEEQHNLFIRYMTRISKL